MSHVSMKQYGSVQFGTAHSGTVSSLQACVSIMAWSARRSAVLALCDTAYPSNKVNNNNKQRKQWRIEHFVSILVGCLSHKAERLCV